MRVRGVSRFVAAVVAVVVCLLAGCKIEGTVDFQADGGTSIALTFEDADGLLGKIHQTCENFRVAFEANVKFVKNPKVEDITPPGGHVKCKVTSNEPFQGRVRFTEQEGMYHFVVPDVHDNEDYSDFRTRIIVSMPGRVIKATKGRIEGNKVIVNTFNFFTRGISITARKGKGSSAGESASGRRAEHDDRGVPVWGWAGLGVLTVGAVAAVAVVAVRKRRRALVTASHSHYSDEAAARVGSRYRRYAATGGGQTDGPSSGEDYPPSQAPHESCGLPGHEWSGRQDL